MEWLSKELQIGMLTLVDMQSEAYERFLKRYGTQKLALAHTEIFMKAAAIMSQQHPK